MSEDIRFDPFCWSESFGLDNKWERLREGRIGRDGVAIRTDDIGTDFGQTLTQLEMLDGHITYQIISHIHTISTS